MPQTMHSILTALAGTLLLLALIFGVMLKWLTRSAALALCAIAVTLNLLRAIDRGAWVWAVLDAAAAVALAHGALNGRPDRTRAQQ